MSNEPRYKLIKDEFGLTAEQVIAGCARFVWVSVERAVPEPNAFVWFWVPSLGEKGDWETGYFRHGEGEPLMWECERTGPQDEPIRYDRDQVTYWMLARLSAPPESS